MTEDFCTDEDLEINVGCANPRQVTTQPGALPTHWPSVHKAYDQAAIEKGYKDADFENKERQDLETLNTALNFIKDQVKKKRQKLKELEE